MATAALLRYWDYRNCGRPNLYVWDPTYHMWSGTYESLEVALLETYKISEGDWLLVQPAARATLVSKGRVCFRWLDKFGLPASMRWSRKWKVTQMWSDPSGPVLPTGR